MDAQRKHRTSTDAPLAGSLDTELRRTETLPQHSALAAEDTVATALGATATVTRATASAGEPLPASQKADRGPGLACPRYFTRVGVHPFDEVAWERRTASISGASGKLIFEQKGVEFPTFWSQTATAVVVSKYFRGTVGNPERESSLRQLIGRVVGTIVQWARRGAYFATPADYEAFDAELTWLLLHQHMAFNSPVWFNVGIETQPQCSACFINSVDDTMDSILSLAKTEGMLFKYGSGAGSNLSPIRSSRELLAGGGEASGPVSFMKGFDAFAGVIKSGGKTRRAAKMVILNADHPDILEFIRCKEKEERKAWALMDAGYDGRIDGEAYNSVFFQNSNNSVRATDAFLKAVESGGNWQTHAVCGGRVMDDLPARDLMQAISEATWVCGDPGMQYDTTINDWHTCPNTARIEASNPCSEYMFLNDSACNLASLNLMRFLRDDGEFDIDAFVRATELTIVAQEILVDFASYPTPRIEANSHAYRPLGLGYANLGALLMTRGLAYDSDDGRALAGALTALMHGTANRQSAALAEQVGPFPGYAINREPMLRVMAKHETALSGIEPKSLPPALLAAARTVWRDALVLGEKHGYRNAQVTVLAPTGTIAFMMDCDTTGIEPDIALVKYKKLVGGGTLKIVNQAVPQALARLGYSESQRADITSYIDQNDTIEGAPHLKDKDLAVFDCAFKPANGSRSIHYLGHLKMMAAAQPFLSGAISKTVNLPHEATTEEITQTYLTAWKLGVKAVAIYRDGCKRIQPLTTKKTDENATLEAKAPLQEAAPAQIVERIVEREVVKPLRKKLPDERQAITHKFSIAGHEGYITVGMYEDGQPGEVFITMAKEGSTLSGLLDAFATAISLALQYGVPLQVLCDKFTATRFEPAGFTGNRDIPMAKSITDYIFRWLALKFLDSGEADLGGEEVAHASAGTHTTGAAAPVRMVEPARVSAVADSSLAQGRYQARMDAPLCSACGRMMTPAGKCYRCDCGQTSGGCS